MVPLHECQLYCFHVYLVIINALGHSVALLFWGILLLLIASYLFNFSNLILSTPTKILAQDMSNLWGAWSYNQSIFDAPKFKGYEMLTPFIY